MLDKVIKTIKNTKLSKIVFYVCTFLMAFSIFFFFMDVLKWDKPEYIKSDIATPSFFDLIFGLEGSKALENTWPILAGMIVLFIFQICLSATCIVVSGLLISKKLKQHTAICILCGVAVVALICGIISFLPQLMIARKYIWPEYVSYWWNDKYEMSLNYGAYIYGITMILSACGSVGAFILDHYNK